MSYLIGPIGVIGHPFAHNGHELPVERRIGDRLCYAFAHRWLSEGPDFIPAEPLEAVVVWDPPWLRTKSRATHDVDELRKVWDVSRKHEVPLIGIYSDWFAGWDCGSFRAGTKGSCVYMDAIITDAAGAATMREVIPPLKVTDPNDKRYRPIVTVTNMMSYGRLPTLGADPDAVVRVAEGYPQEKRNIDVAYIGSMHAGNVVLRSYYTRALRALCEEDGLTCWIAGKVPAEEMERVYLESKVVFNHSLGSTLNMRVFEALACGAVLLTDDHNIANWSLQGAALTYRNVSELRSTLRWLLLNDEERQKQAQMGTAFATLHNPMATWEANLDAVDKALEMVHAEVAV